MSLESFSLKPVALKEEEKEDVSMQDATQDLSGLQLRGTMIKDELNKIKILDINQSMVSLFE